MIDTMKQTARSLFNRFSPARDRSASLRQQTKAGYILREVAQEELGRPHHRHKNPIQVGTLYVFREPQYDVYQATVAVALASRTLFSVPIGQSFTPIGGAAVNKTAWHTSMSQNSLFPQPRKFYIRQLFLYISGYVSAASSSMGVPQDFNGFLLTTLITMLISGRSFLTTHAHRLPSGGGLYGGSSAIMTNGMPADMNSGGFLTWGQNGETIEQGQAVQVTVDPTQAGTGNAVTIPITTATAANDGAGINVHVYLDGTLFRELL